MVLATASDPLGRLLDERLDVDSPVARRFLPAIRASGEGILAVVLYGSRLAADAKRSSEPDFYVVVDSLKRFQTKTTEYLLSLLLPPTTYHLTLPLSEPPEPDRSAKMCVIGADQLKRETSAQAADLHHLGRFSKRVALVYARDENARAVVREAQRSALRIMAGYALAFLPPTFTADEFMLELFRLSYRAEPRVAEPGKPEAILAQDPVRHRAIARLLLSERNLTKSSETEAALYTRPPLSDEQTAEILDLIARSRTRAMLRIPKYLMTFRGWLDYAEHKIERNTGHPFSLSPRTRRHPLLFGWPELLRLRREGILK